MNKKSFIEFMFHNQVVLLGNYMTKSKRRTPYFFNFGQLYTGNSLIRLGQFYAEKIWELAKLNELPYPTVIYGPAYKGIPLAITTVLNLIRKGGDGNGISYAFNRKEVKDHGDRGVIVGKPLGPKDQVIIVDDVVTSGLSIVESIQLIRKRFQSKVVGVIVAVDRTELVAKSLLKDSRQTNGLLNNQKMSALTYITKQFDIPVKPIVTLNEVFTLAKKYNFITQKDFERILSYLKKNNYEKN